MRRRGLTSGSSDWPEAPLLPGVLKELRHGPGDVRHLLHGQPDDDADWSTDGNGAGE